MTLIAKPDTWFKAGTVVKLIDDYRPAMPSGLFAGTRVCQNEGSEARPTGTEYEDEEICTWDEFEVIDDQDCPACGLSTNKRHYECECQK